MKTTSYAAFLITLIWAGCRSDTTVIEDAPPPGSAPEIATLADFDKLAAEGRYPLDRMPPDVLERFRAGLEFYEYGVRRYDYNTIKGVISQDEYRALLDLFSREGPVDGPPCPPTGYLPIMPYSVIRPEAIRSVHDFDVLVANGVHPLDKLSAEALRRLRNNIGFNEHGVVRFRYFEAESELSPEDYEDFEALLVGRDDDVETADEGSAPEARLPPNVLPDHY